MPLCPRCIAEAEWVDADGGVRTPDGVDVGTVVPFEELIPLVDEADRWKLPGVGRRFDPPTSPGNGTPVECSRCGLEFDPGEEPLPIGELMTQVSGDGR